MKLTTTRNHIIVFSITFLFLVFFWKFFGIIGTQVPKQYHLYNMFGFITPVAQAIFSPLILINRMFIKVSMPLAFLVSSPILETLAMQGIQKLTKKFTSDYRVLWKKGASIFLRVAIVGLIFALGHKIPEYLQPTEYSRQLLRAGLFSHLLGGVIFAGYFEYSKSLIAVALLHSALNLATYSGFSSFLYTSIMSIFA